MSGLGGEIGLALKLSHRCLVDACPIDSISAVGVIGGRLTQFPVVSTSGGGGAQASVDAGNGICSGVGWAFGC